jgi:hypothetical protein
MACRGKCELQINRTEPYTFETKLDEPGDILVKRPAKADLDKADAAKVLTRHRAHKFVSNGFEFEMGADVDYRIAYAAGACEEPKKQVFYVSAGAIPGKGLLVLADEGATLDAATMERIREALGRPATRAPRGLSVAARRAQRRLKYWISRSCFFAPSSVGKVPRLRRLPVFGFTLRE